MTLEPPVSGLSAKAFGSLWAPRRFVEDYGPGLTRMRDAAEFDFWHDTSGARIELKAARARSDVLIFQYIRPRRFDVCVCLGLAAGRYRYWVFESHVIRQFLSRQHRASDSFQLRIPPRMSAAMMRCEVASDGLRARLDAAAGRSARRRKPVRLDPVLATVEGWPAVAKSMRKQAIDCGLPDWVFVFRLLEEPIDPDEPGLLPYPEFNKPERRVEFRVRPEPVENVAATAASFFDFLVQYLDDDDIGDSDLEPEETV